jgi:hypothetical protein
MELVESYKNSLICGWKRSEGSNESQTEKMEFHDAGTLREKD